MNDQNLHPIKTHEEAVERGRKGGSTKSLKRDLSLLISKSSTAKCKNCPAICVLKQNYLQQDPNHFCTVPEARAKALWYDKPVMSEEILDRLSDQVLLKMISESKVIRDFKMVQDVVLKKKELDFPKPQRIEQTTQVSIVEQMKSLLKDVKKEE